MHAPSPACPPAAATLGMSACVGGISGWDEKMEEGGEGRGLTRSGKGEEEELQGILGCGGGGNELAK